MTKRMTAGLAAVTVLVGSLACAGGMAREDDTATAQDTTSATAQDTSSAQNPPGYGGMERDTTQVPTDSQPTPTDTFLQQQGTGAPADTAGYSGLEHPDTSGMGGSDTTSTTGVDTSGMSGMSDTTGQMSSDTTVPQ